MLTTSRGTKNVRMARWFSCLAVATALLYAGTVRAEGEKRPTKEVPSFGILRAPAPEQARSQALDWLKGVGKTDETTAKAFDAIWASDRTLLDKMTATLELGDADAKKLLDEARDPNTP